MKNYNSYIAADVKSIEDKNDAKEDSESESTLSKAMEIIKFIPGVSFLVPSITCLTKAGMADFKASDAIDAGEATGKIFTAFTVIGNLASLSPSEASGAMALQEVFQSNLYCKYQKIYDEENKYISKSKADNSEGGYPMFPIYPVVIPIKNGQCNVGDILDGNFKKMKNLNSFETKCSFSFSATDDQCLEDLNIPIMTEYTVQGYLVEGFCLTSSLKKAFKNATDKVVKKETKKQVKEKIKDAEEKAG